MAWPITRDIRAAVRELFPVRRDRWVVIGLVILAAVVSMTELAATYLFQKIILPEGDRSTAATGVLVVAFLAVFGGLRLVNFAREMYRLNVFERALKESVGVSAVSDSWRWAMAMEVTSLLSTAGRIFVVALATVVVAPLFGLAVFVGVAVFGISLSVIYRRQRLLQRGFREAQLAFNPVDNATKVRSRIRAGETGSLVGYLWIVILMGLMLWMVLSASIDPGVGFVLFVALRMLGQTLTEVSKSLMRFVRALAFSEGRAAGAAGADDV